MHILRTLLLIALAAAASAFIQPLTATPSPKCKARSRPLFFAQTLTPPRTAVEAERVTFEGFSTAGPSVGDTVTVVYRPETASVMPTSLVYGYNGWDTEVEQPLVTPLLPQGDQSYVAHVHLPEYARSLKCAVSLDDSGFNWDTNGDQYYNLRVAYIQEERDGVIFTLHCREDGSVEQLGVVQRNDPQELERMVEEELAAHKRRQKQQETAVPQSQADATTRSQPEMTEAVEESNQIHRLRLEASAAGDSLGLGNLVRNEVREIFGAHMREVGDGSLRMRVQEVGKAMAQLGFELGAEEVRRRFLEDGQEEVDLLEFMKLYVELDREDASIRML